MYLTLCIPTNGVVEWVFPVLDSIYEQDTPEELFEVIITDNGENTEFKKKIGEYVAAHKNLMYRETQAVGFLNQVEAFQLASGDFIKFVNHRSTLNNGTLDYLIEYVKRNIKEKPVTYFLNGALKLDSVVKQFNTFDSFIDVMSYYSSWSGGLAIWKTDFEKIKSSKYDSLFPHIAWLFAERNKNNYVIDNTKLFVDVPADDTKKGKYNLWKAFAVHYIALILDLYRDGNIAFTTFEKVRNENYKFLVSLVFSYMILKKPCSYDLSNFKESMNVFYSNKNAWLSVLWFVCEHGVKKCMRLICGKLR